jgi:YrbI family 3-deoxy-D-manno-octulosonate 8-phosphate phosphatase
VVDTVLLDVDGILTDGAVYVDSSGKETKRILFEDIDAIFDLKRAGVKIGFITGEDNEFCEYLKNRFAPDFFKAGCKNKLNAFKDLIKQVGLDLSNVCYAGDSKKDVELLGYLPMSFAPADANQSVKDAAKIVLKASRGQGVVREIANHVLSHAK